MLMFYFFMLVAFFLECYEILFNAHQNTGD